MFFPFLFWRAQVQSRIKRKPPPGDKSHFDGAGHILDCLYKVWMHFIQILNCILAIKQIWTCSYKVWMFYQ